MKNSKLLSLLLCIGLFSCSKIIDLHSESNLNANQYYRTVDEVQIALTGCYNGMQKPMYYEWQMTDLRTDVSKLGSPGSTSSISQDLTDLDIFIPATTHQNLYNYWLKTYTNIRNANIVLQKLGIEYDTTAGAINFNPISPILQDNSSFIADTKRKSLAAEALFIRAYHYFNLVRLYGGVFLIHTPVSADSAKMINRSSVASIYKIIEADLKTATTYLNTNKFGSIPANDIGKVTSWSAKALLAKVHLTRGRKAEAILLLQDVISNSGYGLQPNYADIFSPANEMNNEILFAVRYKAGNYGLGSSFGNDFAPSSSGSIVINGDGNGNNTPTFELATQLTGDNRGNQMIGIFATRYYAKKYLTPVIVGDDGESDWPVLRYADVLLMMAEAKGYTPESIGYINQIRIRAGLANSIANSVPTFEADLSKERKLEFAFENHRFFDMVRYNTTLTTITAEQTMKDHFSAEYSKHYKSYKPVQPLTYFQGNVTKERLLLPIPQHEIDTNTQLKIEQNAGY